MDGSAINQIDDSKEKQFSYWIPTKFKIILRKKCTLAN